MKSYLEKLAKNFTPSIPATHDGIAEAERHFNISFPTDYKEFLLFTNGLEGEVDDGYLVLWSAKELIELNTTYHVTEFIEQIIIFGSDGAEEAFAFDISGTQPSIVKLPFIGMGYIPNEKLADTFEAFLLQKI
ncbi:SMI1 / KNR4 family (SUKH-1) [Chitinophaga sp. CF118]|uniref:SMI1/KNR4 family protein n=1 Tax=Chitinophaga sp. CF118 TaxID=1884367 RepID=UPI0008E5588E|nr:SMI1/KNR4 family protein [Chitinophaga sp. CF118]SFD61184.1 SMI1 / KNR4 family (SUKH-1) [Chitinophaga sp. CF118]